MAFNFQLSMQDSESSHFSNRVKYKNRVCAVTETVIPVVRHKNGSHRHISSYSTTALRTVGEVLSTEVTLFLQLATVLLYSV